MNNIWTEKTDVRRRQEHRINREVPVPFAVFSSKQASALVLHASNVFQTTEHCG
jgi:hypothetical protein